MQYVRQIKENIPEAERLFSLGYRQISNNHRILARIDVVDVEVALHIALPHSQVERWKRRDIENLWRRCYSEDRLESVERDIMGLIRRLTEIEENDNVKTAMVYDNAGVEEYLDNGLEYVELARHRDMVWVYDKGGALREFLAYRFEQRKGVA